jgi:hypothetical protein
MEFMHEDKAVEIWQNLTRRIPEACDEFNKGNPTAKISSESIGDDSVKLTKAKTSMLVRFEKDHVVVQTDAQRHSLQFQARDGYLMFYDPKRALLDKEFEFANEVADDLVKALAPL